VATCAGDGEVRVVNVERPNQAPQVFRHHTDRAKKLQTLPHEPHVLMSCSEDGTGGCSGSCCRGAG
jgi:hypothetical protein